MKEDTILYEVRDNIAYVTFNRPEKHNATRHKEYELLRKYMKQSNEDPNVRAVILSAKGKTFSVSDDISGMKTEGYDDSASVSAFQHWADKSWADWVYQGEKISPFQEMARSMLESGTIFIGAVHGLCLMTEILHPMDFIIAADNAKFSQPDIVINQPSCGGSTAILPRIVGRRHALAMLLDPTPYSAQEAYHRGVVNKVVPEADLMAEAEALAKKLIVYSPKTISVIKKLITRSQGPVDEFLKDEQMYTGFLHGLPEVGAPVGDWVNLLGYPKELLEGLDMSVGYLHRTSKEKK